MNTRQITKFGFIALVLAALTLGGCAPKDDAGGSKEVKLAYVNWAEGVAVTHLMQSVLADMGYTVSTTMADVAPIFAAIAGGDQDIMIETWVPVTHETYWEKFQGQFEDLGTWFDQAKIGLVVPAYTPIDSIPELPEIKDAVDGQIVGIDAGAGIMVATEKAIDEYELDYQLMTSSGPAMTAALKAAIDRKEPVVVTGWAPHWKFARYDLKFLDDPKNVYGNEEQVKFICRTGFKEDMPEVAQLFANVSFTLDQIGSLMDAVARAEGNEKAAVQQWISEHRDLIESWKPAAQPADDSAL